MTDNNTRSAAAVRVAYMRRAHLRRKYPVREQFYKITITPSMVGMSLASVIQSLKRGQKCRNAHLLKRTAR